MTAFALMARQELVLATRSRWTQLFAALFAGLALAVAGSGYVLSGGSGVQDFARTTSSLIQVIVLLVPLTALVLGVLALGPERGQAELLFSQPVGRSTILIGKATGLFVALAAAEVLGFSLAGLVIFWQAGDYGLGTFGLLVVASLVLTAIFIGLAALLASGATGRRTRALGLALAWWCALVLLYDVAALGLASLLPSGTASRLLVSAVIVNPVDAVRTGTLMAIEGAGAFGPASAALLRLAGGPTGAGLLIGGSLLVWLLVPASLACRRLGRQDL